MSELATAAGLGIPYRPPDIEPLIGGRHDDGERALHRGQFLRIRNELARGGDKSRHARSHTGTGGALGSDAGNRTEDTGADADADLKPFF